MNSQLSEAATLLHDLCQSKDWYVCVGVGICDGRDCLYLYHNQDKFDPSLIPYKEIGINVPLVYKRMSKPEAIEFFDGKTNPKHPASTPSDQRTA